ncbi:MAG: hypothetical protein BWY99_02672 [Synergistetes bacterium ADurb.BinA166]|nr:MAG: hypothetical protein BWY99_02672 [Synergistetes bacterium ADurb.BinA166]
MPIGSSPSKESRNAISPLAFAAAISAVFRHSEKRPGLSAISSWSAAIISSARRSAISGMNRSETKSDEITTSTFAARKPGR